MNRLQEKVYEFNKKGGQYCADGFGFPESEEGLRALYKQVDFCKEELQEIIDKGLKDREVREVIDGAGDLLYVTVRLLSLVGVDADVVLNEIHRSNMSKAVDGEFIIENGKIQKGPNYFKPDWDKVLPQAAHNYKRFVEVQE